LRLIYGKAAVVVMFDNDDRENEDDLIMVAQRVRPRRPTTLANLTVYDPLPSIFRCGARRVC
jgi:3,4-dihydroxy-2-butanone 4-phosphate synthase